jgi:hypothetical protein
MRLVIDFLLFPVYWAGYLTRRLVLAWQAGWRHEKWHNGDKQ